MEQQARQRRRILIAVLAFAGVIVVVIVLVALRGSKSSPNPAASAPPPGAQSPVLAPTSTVSSLGAIPVSSLASAAATGSTTAPKAVSAPPPPDQTGLPEIFYVGAEYCPYCAAERWAVVTALSKFGTWSSLGQTHSSSSDVDPNTPTFSFYGATFSSSYLTFSSVEETTNQPQGNSYQPLQALTDAQKTYVQKYDSDGGIPFISFAGKFTSSTQYDPSVLQGLTFDTVATQAVNGSTTVGTSIQSAAGQLVKTICQLTNGQPGNVCSAFS
jgi:hypothetical protein